MKLFQSLLPDPHDPSDKRPKLERARSAAEKENLPLQRSGSQLRRQYSQQETPRRLSSSEVGIDMMGPQQRRMQHQTQQQQYQQQQIQQQMQPHHHQQPQSQQQQQIPYQQQQAQYHQQGGHHPHAQHSHMSGQSQPAYYPAEDPKFYQVLIKFVIFAFLIKPIPYRVNLMV